MNDQFDQDEERDTATAAPESTEPAAIEALRVEKNALQDRLRRTAAEIDNYRKRSDLDRRDQAAHAMADAPEAPLTTTKHRGRAPPSRDRHAATADRTSLSRIIRAPSPPAGPPNRRTHGQLSA